MNSPPLAAKARDAPVVVAFWPWASDAAARDTLRSVLQSSPAEAHVVVPGTDAARALIVVLPDRERRRVEVAPGADTLPAFLADVTAASRADVALVADAGVLPSGWLEALRQALLADDALAAAGALVVGSDGDPYLEPRAEPGPHASEAGGLTAPCDPPQARIPVPAPHCSLLRRAALDLVAPLDPLLEHPAALLEDFAARTLEHGLSCVLVSNIVVDRRPGGPGPCPEAQTRLARAAHPWLGVGPHRRGA